MKLKMVIFAMVLGLSSCAELSQQPTESDINLKKLKCEGKLNPQRRESLSDIAPE